MIDSTSHKPETPTLPEIPYSAMLRRRLDRTSRLRERNAELLSLPFVVKYLRAELVPTDTADHGTRLDMVTRLVKHGATEGEQLRARRYLVVAARAVGYVL
jgi:hypothetical protein